MTIPCSRGINDQGEEAQGRNSYQDPNAPFGLSRSERKWAGLQKPLEQKGYMLRPRYHLGWVGSWVGSRKSPLGCEDSIPLRSPYILMDARRLMDGTQVMLKLWFSTPRDGAELPTLQFFSDPNRLDHPANHCVRLLDAFTIEGFEREFKQVIVEPLLRPFDEPPFVIVAEALSFILQTLEGLEYMHSQNVTHGDISRNNIMMEPSGMFPEGFHGAFSLNRERRLSERHLKRRSRLQAPPRYVYVDFGSSNIFSSSDKNCLVRPYATTWVPPELQAGAELCDPFKADVYALGLTLILELRNRPGLLFLAPALGAMINRDPNVRPSAAEAKQNFVQFLSHLRPSHMRRYIGWAWGTKISLRERLWDVVEYFKLLWHSYRYGLPEDVLAAAKSGGGNV